MYGEAIGTHKLGKGKGCSKLTKLGRLYTYRSKDKPRVGALNVVRIKNGGKEQQQQHTIYYIGECVEESGIHHQYYKSQTDTSSYPHYLHARACAEAEDIVVAKRIAGTADAYPSEYHQRYIDAYSYPVDLRPNALRFIGWHNNLNYSLAGASCAAVTIVATFFFFLAIASIPLHFSINFS